MADRISSEHRSWNMSRIRTKDTIPEKRVRSFLHKAGSRFRLHVKNLPGSPDIVLRKYRTVVFVHGCYWHRHKSCKFAYEPKSRQEFWIEKFRQNVERDERNCEELKELGWKVLIIWECETTDMETVAITLKEILN